MAFALFCSLSMTGPTAFAQLDDSDSNAYLVFDDDSGLVLFDETTGCFAYDSESDTFVLGDFDIVSNIFVCFTESAEGALLGYTEIDMITGEAFHYDVTSGDFGTVSIGLSDAPIAVVGAIGPAIRVVISVGPKVAKAGWGAGKWVAGQAWGAGKWVGGKFVQSGKWAYGRAFGPKPLTPKQIAEQEYVRNLARKGAQNKSVQKVDPTDFEM